MSALSEHEAVERVHSRTGDAWAWLVRGLFGDGYGVALFLGGLCFFGLYWRIGSFITDTDAIATTLYNVANGHLYLAEAPYGAGLEAPGTYVSGERVYGRNYGVVFAALPVVWALHGVATVFDVNLALVGLWCLLVLGVAVTVGRLRESRAVVVGGSALAVLLFGANFFDPAALPPLAYPVVALQVVTMVASGLVGVFVYRLLAGVHDRRTGLFAGGATLLATPIAFWASLPKRHAFTAMLTLAATYALYRSRAADDDRAHLRFRALAYVPVGLLAWVHAAEALLLVVPLVGVDVATARSNDGRTVGVVVGAFLVSLLPFFLTNLAIAGNPIEPPRLLPSYGSTAPSSLSGGGGGSGLLGDGPLGSLLSKGVAIAVAFTAQLGDGALVLVTEPARVSRTFLRSGYIPEVAAKDGGKALSLTVLESAPLLGGLVGVPVVAGAKLRSAGVGGLRAHLRTPTGTVDAFVACTAVLVTLLYMPRLPLHAQVTVRYLHPLFPLSVYALARLPPVRAALRDHWRTALWTYAGSVLVGGQLVVAFLAITDPSLGEAVQFHALLSLATATALAVWLLGASLSARVPRRLGAVALAASAAAGTSFVLLSGLDYFDYAGTYTLPLIRFVTDAVALV